MFGGSGKSSQVSAGFIIRLKLVFIILIDIYIKLVMNLLYLIKMAAGVVAFLFIFFFYCFYL